MKWVFAPLLFSVVFSLNAGAAPEAKSLPRCVSDEAEIEAIVQTQKQHPKDPQKYDGYREAFKNEPDAVLLARLVYAETLAGNCPQWNSKIFPYITESITARIRIRKGDVKRVIFQRDQHSSSMNIYSESRYRDFLCPKDAELWRQVLNASEDILANPTRPLVLPPDTTHYYLYMHSSRFKTPDWAGEQSPWPLATFPGDGEVKPCILFFRDSAWR